MKATAAVKEVMQLTNTRMADLQKALDLGSNTLSGRLKQENVSVSKLSEMLSVMGYKVSILPQSAQTPEDGFDIE